MLRSSYPVFKTKIIKVTSTQPARSSNDTSACTLSTWMPSFMEVIYMRSENFMTVPRLWAKTTPREQTIWLKSAWFDTPASLTFSFKRQKQVSLQQINRSRYHWRQPNKENLSIKAVRPAKLLLIQEAGHYHLRVCFWKMWHPVSFHSIAALWSKATAWTN